MSLTLYLHPLSSFCHKALIALYENGTPFNPHIVDLMAPLAERYDNAARYLARLRKRPSFARVIEEAEPYFKLFPM